VQPSSRDKLPWPTGGVLSRRSRRLISTSPVLVSCPCRTPVEEALEDAAGDSDGAFLGAHDPEKNSTGSLPAYFLAERGIGATPTPTC
jgi:hypothetical protein